MVYRRSGGGGGGGGGGGPAPFLVKTYEMVEEAGTDEVVSWGEKGASFVVWKPAEFASDLLPLHFKHNNFSSFVRQLNTYGFRKVVPDRWEFTNDNFRRGERRLLCKIRRRKPPAPTSRLQPSDDKPSARRNTQLIPPSSASNSGDMHSSSSASSPLLPLPCLPSNQLLELANENEKLRKDNHVLNTELAQAKCHFQELLGFLSKYVDVSQLNLSLLMGTEAGGETGKKEGVEEESAQGKEQGIKLFGVLLKGFEGEEREKTGGTKRQRCEGSSDGCGHGERPLTMSFALPWMGISTPLQQGSSRVDCN